jgi:hypothetical protein
MAMTFSALCKLADFRSAIIPTPAVVTSSDKDVAAEEVTPLSTRAHRTGGTIGGLHYNIQVILPDTRDPKVYDAIFRSLREHLL